MMLTYCQDDSYINDSMPVISLCTQPGLVRAVQVGLLTPLLTNPLTLHLHHHFPQTRLAGSCTAELQACTVFRK